MSKRCAVMVCALAVALGSATTVLANFIWEWGGAPGGYLIDQVDMKVTITAPGTYKFAASDETDPDNLGVIDLIEIQEGGVEGTVNVYVTKEHADANGVARLKEINLCGATTGNIVTIRARDSVADEGNVVATNVVNGITTWTIVHDVIILDALDGWIWCHWLGNFHVADATYGNIIVFNTCVGSVEVDGSLGYFGAINLLGKVYVGGAAPEIDIGSMGVGASVNVTGELTSLSVGGDFQAYVHVADQLGTFTIGGMFAPAGRLLVDGSLKYSLQIEAGPLAGAVTIGEYLSGDGSIAIPNGSLTGTVTVGQLAGNVYVGGVSGGDLSGSLTSLNVYGGTHAQIEINGDLTGTITFGGPANPAGHTTWGSVYVAGLIDDASADLSGGHIDIYGSFGSEIESVGGFAGDTEYIAVDVNGGDMEDSWLEGGVVRLGGTNYYGNTPSMHLWDVSDCRGDFNSDWVVDVADLNLWFTALNDPSAYALAYPGLGTSRVLHGDTNCDGTFNGYDRASFLDRMSRQCCDVECPGCQTLERMAPGSLAQELGAGTWPEYHGDMVAAVADTAAEQAEPPDQVYWQTVYEGVTE